MKKWMILIVALFLMVFVKPCSADTGTNKIEVINNGWSLTLKVNGAEVKCDQLPYINSTTGRTMVPIRFAAEALGAKVDWEANAKKATIEDSTQDKKIELTIGSDTALVNGEAVKLDAPAELKGSRTMVPLRFVGETLGAEVTYTQVQDSTASDPRIGSEIRQIKAMYPDSEVYVRNDCVIMVCYGMVPFDSLGGKESRVVFTSIYDYGNCFLIVQYDFSPGAYDTLANVANIILSGSSAEILPAVKKAEYANPVSPFKYGGRNIRVKFMGQVHVEIK